MAHVYFHRGLGLGITAAREKVASLLGEDAGTIRSWERKLKKHADYVRFWKAAELEAEWGPKPLNSELESKLVDHHGAYEGERLMQDIGVYRLGAGSDFDYEPLRQLMKQARLKP